MYLVIRKINRVSPMAEAARWAKSGIGQVLKQIPGSRASMSLVPVMAWEAL
jgi:hypothetical protein